MWNVKGTYDRMGKEQAVRRKVIALLEETFERYDFAGMESTILCELDLLASKYTGGEEIVKETYQLSDQGQRSLGLRYDLTVPFAKVVASKGSMELPIRRYEIGKVFRDGPVKRGRLREFTQCDVDLAGVAGPEAEVELLQLAAEVFGRLKLPVVIRWNNRRFLTELLEALGVERTQWGTVMLTLDKEGKLPRVTMLKELLDKGIELQVAERVMALLEGAAGLSLDDLAQRYGIEQQPGLQETRRLQALLELVGLAGCCRFDPFLSRGLAFYTGTVYEIFDATGKFTSSLGAGGRYDGMIGELVGREELRYPTVGLSFGMESIMALIEESESKTVEVSGPAVVVVAVGGGAVVPEALRVAAELRACGLRTGLETGSRKLKKVLAALSARSVPYAVLIGQEELEQGKVRLKDMMEQEEFLVTAQELLYMLECRVL